MEQPVYAQAVQAGLALLLGIGLGIFYDALKAVRLAPGRGRRHPALTVAADVLFCAVLAFALFSFGLGPGEGSLRAFMLACAGCGWGLYALTLSPLALRFFGLVVKWLCKAAAPGLRCLSKLQKIKKFQKNIFPKFRTRFTMIKNRRGPSRRGGISPEGGGRLEECKGRYTITLLVVAALSLYALAKPRRRRRRRLAACRAYRDELAAPERSVAELEERECQAALAG